MFETLAAETLRLDRRRQLEEAAARARILRGLRRRGEAEPAARRGGRRVEPDVEDLTQDVTLDLRDPAGGRAAPLAEPTGLQHGPQGIRRLGARRVPPRDQRLHEPPGLEHLPS